MVALWGKPLRQDVGLLHMVSPPSPQELRVLPSPPWEGHIGADHGTHATSTTTVGGHNVDRTRRVSSFSNWIRVQTLTSEDAFIDRAINLIAPPCKILQWHLGRRSLHANDTVNI